MTPFQWLELKASYDITNLGRLKAFDDTAQSATNAPEKSLPKETMVFLQQPCR